MDRKVLLPLLKRRLALWNRHRLDRRAAARRPAYADWCRAFDTLDAQALGALRQRLLALPQYPPVAVVVDGDVPAGDAAALLRTLQAQIYPHWRLYVHDAALAAGARAVVPGVAGQPANLVAAGDEPWLVFVDATDRLRPHALLLLVEAALAHAGTRLVYADEDLVDADGVRHAPWFKGRLLHELLLSHDAFGRGALHARAALPVPLPQGPGWRHALALHAGADPAAGIVHVPHVLVHGAAAGTCAGALPDASAAAVQAHLDAHGIAALADAAAAPGRSAAAFAGVRVHFALPEPPPRVSIVIPTRNGGRLLARCLDSLRRCRYPAFEVIVVDNGSDAPRTLRLLRRWCARWPQLRVRRDDRPFNFAALNNAAVAQSTAELIALVNDDIEFADGDWLGEMVSLALQPGVGAVGARLLYGDGTLQHGGVLMGLGGAAGHVMKRLPRHDPGPGGRGWRLQNYVAVTAACLVVRRAHWAALGGMDETLAVAYNDVDFCARLHAAGLRTVWTPHAQLFHHESASRGCDKRRPDKAARLAAEHARLAARHAALIADDPAYNPNLTLRQENFALAWPPRVSLRQRWYEPAR